MRNIEKFFSSPRNFAGIPSPLSDLENSRVVILPVPYDGTAEWHPGSRHGPQAIIDASEYLEFYDLELDREIQKVGIHTLPSVLPDNSSPENMIELVYEISHQFINKSKFILALGGEHTISLGIVKAYLEKYPDLCVLQLDAHADLREEYNNTRFSQASVMRRISEICPIVEVGVRSLSLEEKIFIDSNKIPVFYQNDNLLDPVNIEKILNSLSDNIYLTIDLDVLDPSIMSAVGTPEPGGIYWQDIIKFLKAVSEKKHVVGADIVELCPGEGTASCVFLTAKLAYKIIGYFNQ
jgi:agmatinase